MKLTLICYIAEDDLEFLIFLPLPSARIIGLSHHVQPPPPFKCDILQSFSVILSIFTLLGLHYYPNHRAS